MNDDESRSYWNEAAKDDPAWYVATGHKAQTDAFFRQGAAETDSFLRFCDIVPDNGSNVLEIGCGVGRMTRRLAELFGHVTAVDISEEMLSRCAANVADADNVDCLVVPGDGLLPGVGDASVDVVFSYITFQHLPSPQNQLAYLAESARVMGPNGRMGIQIRSSDAISVALEYTAHMAHVLQRRRTLNRSWRGSRLATSAIVGCLHEEGVEAEVRDWRGGGRWSPRHRWIVGTKPSSARRAAQASAPA